MKKIYSFILAAVLCCTSNVWAGELTVADGTNSNNCVPFDGYSGEYFQRVQIIYPQSELTAMAGKDITSLTFYVNSQASSALGVKVQIGLAEISDSDFSAGKAYKSATLTIVKAEDVWDLNAATVVVEFSEPFSYSGEGSILFDLQTVAIGGYGNTSFYGVGSLANYQSVYSYNESSIPATSPNRYKFIPKTTFTYEEPASAPVSPVTAARFLYNYDCQRNPAYPKQGSPCTLWGFSDPYVGYNGIGSDAKNTPFGPWKLEFVANYTPSNDYGCQRVVTQAVNQYYSSLSNQEKEAKRLEVPIFRLWQYNIVAGEYQHASYGIVCAYADEGNAEDHGALFISSEGNGCFLAGEPHNAQISLSCENDLTTGLNNLVTAASATDPDYDAYMPVILSIDAIGTVELTQHCKDFIEGSNSAYNALTDAQKGQVTNYQVLVDAKNQWAPLVAEAKPYADAVVDLINAIPNPIVYTQSCKDAIDAAQAAYDALTSGQKLFVSNYETLKNAPFDLINAAPYAHILFKANDQEKKVENVTLPKEFTDAEMTTMIKELYGVEGDYDLFAYSYVDAVNISYGKWTINPFMGTVNVNGDLNKFDPETGMDDMIPISLEITLELPPYEPEAEQDPTGVENVQTNQLQSTKVLRDGQLLILRGDKVYTLQGAEVK